MKPIWNGAHKISSTFYFNISPQNLRFSWLQYFLSILSQFKTTMEIARIILRVIVYECETFTSIRVSSVTTASPMIQTKPTR